MNAFKIRRIVLLLGAVIVTMVSRSAGADSGPWTAASGYSSSTSGPWFFTERNTSTSVVSSLPWQTTGGYLGSGFDGFWGTYDSAGWRWIYYYDTRPGDLTDTIRTWVAPAGFAENISILGNVYQEVPGASAGAKVWIELTPAGTTTPVIIWPTNGVPKILSQGDTIGYDTDSDLSSFTTAAYAGDKFSFVVSSNGTYSPSLQVGWNPTILASYTASSAFSSSSGLYFWTYEQRDVSTGVVTPMTWVSGGYSPPATGYWKTSDAPNTGYIYWTDMRAGASHDSMRTWKANSTGTVSISGSVYQEAPVSSGAGILASVVKNYNFASPLWTRTVASNDGFGYAMDGESALTNISVTAGDTISFVANSNGTPSDEHVSWNPIITYANSRPTSPHQISWDLHTQDTLLSLEIVGDGFGDRPAITRLEDAAGGWNWITAPISVPLPKQVTIAGNSAASDINWVYQSGSSGLVTTGTVPNLTQTLTLVFKSVAPWPALTLTQTWVAHLGSVGPVEETVTITNNSSTNAVTFKDSDIVAANITVTSDAAAKQWRFPRLRHNDSLDPYFTSGSLVLGDTSASSQPIESTVTNSPANDGNGYVSPFLILDVGGAHGLYLGYSCDFGKFTTTWTSTNNIAIKFRLGDASNSFTLDASALNVPLPGMFYGVYIGDIETGSNHMKSWFYTHDMTSSIRATSNEPLVQVTAALDNYTEEASFLADYPNLASTYHVESIKEDAEWSDDFNATDHGSNWDPAYLNVPDAGNRWPYGFDDGYNVHAYGNGMRFVHYLANTYRGADLSTSAGVSAETMALAQRFQGAAAGYVGPTSPTPWIGYGFDTWRTDSFFEASLDYKSHLGFLQVVDTMIVNHPAFRWENCSGAGSKKSFDLLERASYVNLEDSAPQVGIPSNPGGFPSAIENFRMSYYCGSYWINPVQLEDTNVLVNVTSPHQALTDYMFRTGFLGAWANFLAQGYTIGDSDYLNTYIPLYQNYQRPILRGADVYHILSPNGTYQPDGKYRWDGVEFFNPGLDKGSVLLFKPLPAGSTACPSFQLRGLNPTRHYTLTFMDRTGLNSTYLNVLGSTLMSTVINFPTNNPTDFDSEIIWIDGSP